LIEIRADAILSSMAWAALAISVVSVGIAIVTYLANRSAIRGEASDRERQIGLLEHALERAADSRTRDLIGAGTAVCQEFAQAAHLLDALEAGRSPQQDVVSRLPRVAWRKHQQELAGLFHGRETHWLTLWREVEEAEGALDRASPRGEAELPRAEHLRGLAGRLDDAVVRLASGER
jgi:hypothetical protein